MEWNAVLAQLFAALLIGLLIGIERGWTLRDAVDGTRVAGVRTFTLIGLSGGLVAVIARSVSPILAVIPLIGIVVALALGYARPRSPPDNRDATTVVAAFLALMLGLLAGAGFPAPAIATAAVTTVVLAFRREAHGLIDRMDHADLKAFVRYVIIVGAIFPLLPNAPYGPYGAWNPQMLWLVVVLVTGFSFAGYAANRMFGVRKGTLATAAIGGAYSSTAVTASLAQRIAAGESSVALPAGIALASAIMYLRVLVLVAILATSVLAPLAAIIAPALVVQAIACLVMLRRGAASDSGHAPVTGNPIAIVPALGFLLFIALAAVAARWAEARYGQQGIAVLLLITGSLDVDAAIVTLSGLKAGTITASFAAQALAGTVLINMLFKTGVVVAFAGWSRGWAGWSTLALSSTVLALSIGATVLL